MVTQDENHFLKRTRKKSEFAEQYPVATIVGFEVLEQQGETFTAYEIRVEYQRYIWKVLRRFSDFEYLESQLIEEVQSYSLELPPKKIFGNLEPSFLQIRFEQLKRFLLLMSLDYDISGSKAFAEFIRLPHILKTIQKIEAVS